MKRTPLSSWALPAWQDQSASQPAGPSHFLPNTSILHHAFISTFIALWAVITHYVTILCLSLLFYKVYMKRENADSWDSGLEKEQILETYSAQLQKF